MSRSPERFPCGFGALSRCGLQARGHPGVVRLFLCRIPFWPLRILSSSLAPLAPGLTVGPVHSVPEHFKKQRKPDDFRRLASRGMQLSISSSARGVALRHSRAGMRRAAGRHSVRGFGQGRHPWYARMRVSISIRRAFSYDCGCGIRAFRVTQGECRRNLSPTCLRQPGVCSAALRAEVLGSHPARPPLPARTRKLSPARGRMAAQKSGK